MTTLRTTTKAGGQESNWKVKGADIRDNVMAEKKPLQVRVNTDCVKYLLQFFGDTVEQSARQYLQ